jgi:hypothetical protein
VKRVVKELDLRETLKQGSSYLDSRRQQKALDAGRDAVEYLASVVEFDAFDKFKNVSLIIAIDLAVASDVKVLSYQS